MHAYFTPQAEADLEEIGDYIAADHPQRALSFVREIRAHCKRIGEGPMHYAARRELGRQARACPHGDYVIFFEPYQDGALILRILHGARDFPEVFA